jgi:hypothetical protein
LIAVERFEELVGKNVLLCIGPVDRTIAGRLSKVAGDALLVVDTEDDAILVDRASVLTVCSGASTDRIVANAKAALRAAAQPAAFKIGEVN